MRIVFLFIVFAAFSAPVIAQESSCGDGIDNDGDGFIDCFDGDCANKSACDDFYIGKDKLCQTPPTGTLKFGMKLGATSEDRTTLSYGRMVVGDLDRDGIPEMVTTHNNDKRVYILNGNDLSIKREIKTIGNPEYFDHAIANLDDDNCAEIFIVESDNCKWSSCDYFVTSYDCNGNMLWRTEAYGQPFTIGLADFDYDGNVELYYKNEILDAKTGEVLVKGKGDWNDYDSGPVAVDILPDAVCPECAGLELVLGGEIYGVDLSPRTPGGGSVGTPIKKFNDLPGLGGITYYPKYVAFGYVNSMTSVADYNLDGHLDVVMNGATSKSATSTTTVFFWDVYNNKFKTFQPKQPDGSSWPHGTGRINLADVDGDGKMNATFVSGARIYSLKEDFTLLWQKTIAEQTSGFTSTTVFDFNNDNAVEIVYRDEANLYIIDGKTGNAFTTVTCRSRTANDYPIVVDVDADGATEICVSCSTKDNVNINNNGNTPFGQIRTFKSSLEPWVSARKVWNQYAYFNVNVNDDLTIPQVQQEHHLVFSSGVCGIGDNRALNSFLNQSAILDSKGCKTYPSADVAFVANPSLLNVIPPKCPDKDFVVSFSLENIGDLDLNGTFPVTFYNGDPRLPGAVKLRTEVISFNNFKIGDRLDVDSLVVTGNGSAFTLFAVLNDNGSTVPTPISLPNSGFTECNFSNNIVSASVTPTVFELGTFSTNHLQCGAGPSSPNGSARVFKPEGATKQTVGYTFYWFKGNAAGTPAAADFRGPLWNGLANGTYTVYAKNDAYQCGSDTVQVAIGLQTRTISATVKVDHAYTNCNSPDGQLSVVPDDGQPLNKYKFEWFQGTVFGTSPTLSDSSALRFTRASTYSVLVTEKSSHCETLESATVPDLTVTPQVTTTSVPANCVPAASGQAAATVAGGTAGYTFYWYDGSTSKPSEDFLGAAYQNRVAGDYTVIAKDNTTGCTSSEKVVTVGNVAGITVNATVIGQQTSCALPNGAASANVGGTTSGYTFRWFSGNNTANQIGTGAMISGLAAGEYSVEARSTATGCTDTRLITIVDAINTPSVTASVTSQQTHCFPVNGAVSAVATGSPGPYQYYWFTGNVGTPDTATADFKGAARSGLRAGFYTVVAVDINSRCGSARALIEVPDATTLPAITTTVTSQTSCDAAHPNGGATANVNGSSIGYKFRWFAGADTTSVLIQSPMITGMAAGTYTVKAVNQATGCWATQQVVINDSSARPSLSLTATDNTICTATLGYTGSVSASLVTNPNAQPGHTFVYAWARNGASLAGQSASSLTNLNAGTYSVTVENETLGCTSSPVSIVVKDVLDLPTLTTANTASTNCVPGLENGRAEVLTVDNIAVSSTTDYTYQWHTGIGTTSPIATATNPTADQPRLDDVQGGAGFDYTVLVTNVLNGCTATVVVPVADAKILPELSLVATDNGICDPALTAGAIPYNGTITATVDNLVNSISDYDFAFGGGMGPGVANANVYAQLNGGPTAYTVTATHSPTGCVSAPASVQVNNKQNIPDLETSSDASTNCVPGLVNGKARVVTVDSAAATTTGFTFAWTGPALFDITANPTRNAIELEEIQGGAGYDYTITVTNQANGCTHSAVVNVADGKEIPTLALTATPNSICDPTKATFGGGAFDGQVSASVNAAGNYAGSAVGDFVFTWDSGLTGAGLNVLSNLDVGSYSVTAVHAATGCASSPYTAQVISAKAKPVISMGSTPSQNCAGGAPDGVASVTNVLPAGKNYDYRWFDGNSTSGAPGRILLNTTGTTDDYANVQGGGNGMSLYEYTVEVTILQTGCLNTATVSVGDDSQLPVVGSLTPVSNTLCTVAKNGSATASTLNYRGGAISASDYGDFTFTWSGGTQGPAETISGLAAGSYTLTVTHNDDRCVSNPVSVTIEDDLFIPDLEIASVDQTSCNPLAPNGSLTATVDETSVGGSPLTTIGYTFTWVNDVTSATTASNTIANLGGNQNYTISVVRNSTQCANSQTVYLNETLTIPTVAVNVTDMTICAPANGALAATNLPGHSYYWYDGSDAGDQDAVISGADFTGGATYSNLVPGDYTLVVMDDLTKCKSQQIIKTVADASPRIQPVVANTIIPVDCNTTGGTLDAAVQFISADFAGLAATNELTFASPLTGLAVGDQVIIQRKGAQTLPVGLEENKVYFVESIDVTNTVLKLSTSTGGPEIDIIADGTGTAGDFVPGGYDYEWFAGIPSPSDPGAGSINFFSNPPLYSGASLSVLQTISGIGTGVYTVQITDQATGCKNYLSHTLPFIGSHAVIKVKKTNSTICPYTLGNGSIEIQIENPAGAPAGTDQNDYQTTLTLGPAVIKGPYAPGAGYESNPFVISNVLVPGSYMVEVRETYTGFNCAVSQEVIIGADAMPPVISLASAITPNSACDPASFDGEVEISIGKDPKDLTGAGITYDIAMSPDPQGAFPLSGQPLGNYAASSLGPGAYAFTVSASNGCSAAKSFTVLDKPVKSQFSIAHISVSDAEYCDVNLEQSAKVVVNQLNLVSGGIENLDDYRFDWYTDASLTNNIYSATGNPSAAKGGEELSNNGAVPFLPSQRITNGAYWVVAKKLVDGAGTGGLGCSSAPFNVHIGSKRVAPAITLTPSGDTACDPNVFEGAIRVDVITASGPGATGMYDYKWAPSAGPGQPLNTSGNSGAANMFSNINDGAYQLTATNQLTGCAGTLSTTVTKAAPPSFTLSASVTDLTECASFNGRIDNLQVFADGIGGNIADFDYVWFKSDLLPGSKVLDGQSGAVAVDNELTAATYPGITADPYFVKAIRKAGGPGIGCASTALKKEITDARVYPQLSFETVSSTACDGNFDGRITVDAQTFSGPGATSNYNFVWTDDPDGLAGASFSAANSTTDHTPAPFTTLNTDRIGEGLYRIRVTNFVTQCFTDGTVEVTKKTIPMAIASVTASPVDVCSLPQNGGGTVSAIKVNNISVSTADFAFTWDDDFAMNSPFLSNDPSLTSGPLDIGTYYVRAKRKPAVSPPIPGVTGSGCATPPLPFVVMDKRVYPSVNFATLPSTACDGNFDGKITVTANTASGPGAGANYNFVWTDDPDGLSGSAFSASNSPDNNTASPFSTAATDLIGKGTYRIRVTNATTQCFTDGTAEVANHTVPVEVLTASATPQQLCTIPADGSVSVALADVRVGGSLVPGGIAFDWADSDGHAVGTGTTISNLSAGAYILRATRTSGMKPASGCVSAPLTVEVKDAREYPIVTFSTLANTTCNDDFDAKITVTASTDAGPGKGANYDFNWAKDPGGAVAVADAVNMASPYMTPLSDNVGPGTYALTVTNAVTRCSTDASVTVLQNTAPVQILNVTKNDQRDCAPFDGSIAIDTSNPAQVSIVGAYTFAWEKAGVPLSPVPDNALTGADAGVYTITGTKTSGRGAGCTTAPFRVTLLDLTKKPTIQLTSQANFACDPGLANGGISAVVLNGTSPAPVAEYSLEWFSGVNDTSGSPIANDAALTGQLQGDYTLKATDKVSPGLGCFNTATSAIGFDKTSFSFSVATTDQNLCPPLQNGSVKITGITEVRQGSESTTTTFAQFGFQWFDEAGTPHSATPAFAAGANSISNVLAGQYSVQVKNSLGCTSSLVEARVKDLTVLPVITLDNFQNPAICTLPETPGFLQVSADNSLNFSDYTFEWFEGPDGTGPMVEPDNATLANVQYNQPLQYTVRVTNKATGCMRLESYRFSVDTMAIEVVASAIARTNCTIDDGSLFATTLNGGGSQYDYQWFAGPTPSGSPLYVAKTVAGVPVGEYTVVAVHPDHSFCSSKPYTTRVPDARVFPPVVAIQKNPVTWCDPANPNGVAYTTVNDEVTGYTFDWYQGSVGATPFYTGSEAAGLTSGTYMVKATDNLTGCDNTVSIEIGNSPVNVPEPTVVVVSHLTNCAVPDGVLSASVDGNTAGYFLQWYDGRSVKKASDGTGEFYRDLDKGFYTTTATDRISGCVSDPVVTEILPFQERPEFNIATQPTNCEQDIGEARLVPLNDVPLLTVEWDINGATEFGTMLSGLPKGQFTVTATSYNACVASKTFEIIPEVLVFNGISRNSDGQNDFFEIACIEDFPNNDVKIFNRAGTLVFEAHGYDNREVFFDGVSNRGISLLGTNLPDGTYFYIIDKGDGSRPRSGYLELLSK